MMNYQEIKNEIASMLEGEAINQWGQYHRELINEYVCRVQGSIDEYKSCEVIANALNGYYNEGR